MLKYLIVPLFISFCTASAIELEELYDRLPIDRTASYGTDETIIRFVTVDSLTFTQIRAYLDPQRNKPNALHANHPSLGPIIIVNGGYEVPPMPELGLSSAHL